MPLQRVVVVDPEGIQVAGGASSLRVHGDAVEGLRVGQEVSIHATFTPEGTLRAHAVTHHPLRPHKRWLGVIGVAILVGLLAVTFTVRRCAGHLRVVPRA